MILLQDCHNKTTRRRAYDYYSTVYVMHCTCTRHIVSRFIQIAALIRKSERKPIKKKVLQTNIVFVYVYYYYYCCCYTKPYALHTFYDDDNDAILLLPICVDVLFAALLALKR